MRLLYFMISVMWAYLTAQYYTESAPTPLVLFIFLLGFYHFNIFMKWPKEVNGNG